MGCPCSSSSTLMTSRRNRRGVRQSGGIAIGKMLDDAGEDIKRGAKKGWRGTKRLGRKGWSATKRVGRKGWRGTKRLGRKGWSATKRVGRRGWNATKRGARKVRNKM